MGFLGHMLMENRNGLVVETHLPAATGTAELEAPSVFPLLHQDRIRGPHSLLRSLSRRNGHRKAIIGPWSGQGEKRLENLELLRSLYSCLSPLWPAGLKFLVYLDRLSYTIRIVACGWKSPTVNDVARLARVSVATVSAVINGTKVVSPRRSQRVREAMAALDYHVDQNARSLRTGKSRVVGVIIPDLTNPFYTQVVAAAEEVASRAGYSFFLCNSNDDPAQEQRHLDMLFSHRVAAVLIASCDSAVAYDRLIRRRFPLVFFDRIPPGFQGCSVETDNHLAAYLATRHLIELGHRLIAILAGNIQRSTHARRLEGFRKAMQEAGLPVRDEYCGLSGLTAQAAYQFSLGLLQSPQAPTAVFCTSNNLLLGCFQALECVGLRCPADVSIIGFDDFPWNETFRPAITTVAQPTAALGSKAMEVLLERISGGSKGLEIPDQNVVLQPELRVRNSTAPPSPAPPATVGMVPTIGSDANR